MSFIYSIIAAFSMFSALPVPQVPWEKEKIRYMLVCLPFVGVIIGAAEFLWLLLSEWLSAGTALTAAGLTLIPILLTGGIHLDGFLDTVDALKSHAAPEKKRAILKDPHTGAFAVIVFGCYLLAYYALCQELGRGYVLSLGIAHVMSRSLSAVSGTLFPVHHGEGTLSFFRQVTDRKAGFLALCWLALSAAALILLQPLTGSVMVAGALATTLWIRHVAIKEFEGMSGDIAGFQLQTIELVMLTIIVLMERILAL